MRWNILLILLLSFVCNAFGGWQSFWPITTNNITTNYGYAINDLLCANAERYSMNIADITQGAPNYNRWSWNPYPNIYIERNFLIPIVKDLGTFSIVTNLNPVYTFDGTNYVITSYTTNYSVYADQTNTFVTNNVTVGNHIVPLDFSYYYSYVQADLPHYGLVAFDVQFRNIIKYPTYYASGANYWLDYTKAGAQTNYAEWFATASVTSTWTYSLTGTNKWRVAITTNYPTDFPHFVTIGDFLKAVPDTNTHPVYKMFWTNSGPPRLQNGWEVGQYTNRYAIPTNYVPNPVTNTPSSGIFCALVAEQKDSTNICMSQSTMRIGSWKASFYPTYPLMITISPSNLPYSKLDRRYIYNTNLVNGIHLSTNETHFYYAGLTKQIYNTTTNFPEYMTTNWTPWYIGVSNVLAYTNIIYTTNIIGGATNIVITTNSSAGYPTDMDISVSNQTGWILIGMCFNSVITNIGGNYDNPAYMLTKYSGGTNTPPLTLSGGYIEPGISEDRWYIRIYENVKNNQFYKNNDMIVYYLKAGTTGYGDYLGYGNQKITSSERVEEQLFRWTNPSEMWSFLYGSDGRALGPFLDPALQNINNVKYRFVPAKTNYPIIYTNFTGGGTEFAPKSVDVNGWEIPYQYRTGRSPIVIADTNWHNFTTNIFQDFNYLSNNYARIVTNLNTAGFYATNIDYSHVGDKLEFYFNSSGDLYFSREFENNYYYYYLGLTENINSDMLNGRKERLISATKHYYSPAIFGGQDTLYNGQTTFINGDPAIMHPNDTGDTYFNTLWHTAFLEMDNMFRNGVSNQVIFKESPSIAGYNNWARWDYDKQYYTWDEHGDETHQGGRSETKGVLADGYSQYYMSKIKVDPYYWIYPATAGVNKVVTYGAKGRINGVYPKYVAVNGPAMTNWLDYTSWSYSGNYGLVTNYNVSTLYTHTNSIGLTNSYISSGYSESTYSNKIYENIYDMQYGVGGVPGWSYWDNWQTDSYGTYAGQYRYTEIYINWTTPSFIGFVDPLWNYP